MMNQKKHAELVVILTVWTLALFLATSPSSFGIAVIDYTTAETNPADTGTGYNMDWGNVYRVTGSGAGTGVAISDHWLITANHVASNTPADHNLTIGSETYTGLEVVNHNAADDPEHTDNADLSLIRYDKTFPGFYDLYDGSVTDTDTLLVGYGRTGTVTDNPGPQTDYYNDDFSGAGTKRWGTNTVSQLYAATDSQYGYTSEGYSQRFRVEDTDFEAGGLPGDSGGGSFIYDGSDWRLAGVNILVLISTRDLNGDGNDQNDYVGTFSASMPEYQTWITSVIPEPTTLLLLVSAGALCLFRRHT